MTDQAPTTPDTVVVPVEDLLHRLGYIVPYLEWTISDESPGYHPTLPSAVRAFKADLSDLRQALAARPAATPGGEREAVVICQAAFKAKAPEGLPSSPLLAFETGKRIATDAILAALPRPAPVAVDPMAVTLHWVKVETAALEEWRAEFGDYVALVTLGHDNVWAHRVNNSGRLNYKTADEAKEAALTDLRNRLSVRLKAARETMALYITPQPAAARGGEDVWNPDMGAAPTDGRRVITIDKWGNTSHARYDDSLPKGFPEAGPKGWVHAKTGHKLETRFECFEAWTFAPDLSALSAKGGS